MGDRKTTKTKKNVSLTKKNGRYDEEFVTDVWIPTLRRTGHLGRVTRLPSHAFRRGVPPSRRPAEYRRFQYSRRPPVVAPPSGGGGGGWAADNNDPVVEVRMDG